MKRIAIAILTVAVVGAILFIGCVGAPPAAPSAEVPPTEFRTYSRYGFSFQYPKEFTLTEMGLFEVTANDQSGMVDCALSNEEYQSFTVSWVKTVQYSLEGGLAGGIAGMEQTEDIASVETGEIVEATHAGHRLLYQFFAATATTGERACGIQAALYCDRTEKIFTLMTFNTTITTEEEALVDFQNCLDSFVCH